MCACCLCVSQVGNEATDQLYRHVRSTGVAASVSRVRGSCRGDTAALPQSSMSVAWITETAAAEALCKPLPLHVGTPGERC